MIARKTEEVLIAHYSEYVNMSGKPLPRPAGAHAPQHWLAAR